jgi:trimethylamine--corrinoid protein Co-methyltransferase
MATDPLRPSIKLLKDSLLRKILDEAYVLLETKGVFVENAEAIRIFLDGGARRENTSKRILIPHDLTRRAVASSPKIIRMFDASGKQSYEVGGDHVHFDPGSAALRIFDHRTQSERPAITSDLCRFHSVVQRLEHFHFQSTGLISSDVSDEIADCYRLFVALQCCSKPIVTGLFVVDGFRPMYEMLVAIRGGAQGLKDKPLAILDACPSPPLKWSNLTAQSVIDCARAGIPSEFVSMPLTGATSPVTLAAALVQLTAENLSGIVLAQSTNRGAPVIFGGSPAAFDMKTANAPMGAIETMMIDSAYSQIGKELGLPTHAYMGLSDSKCVDSQAGLESGIGAILAALSGVNVVSGGGMLDFESCQSLEKLVIDNEICGMAYRLIQGIAQRDEPIALDLFSDLTAETEFMTHPHTLQWYQIEQAYPHIIDRGNQQQWLDSGKPTLADRAAERIEDLLAQRTETMLPTTTANELGNIMRSHAKRFGMETLPQVQRY